MLPRGREHGAVCFLLSLGLALELSAPAYTRARTRAWVLLPGARGQQGPGASPNGVGGGRPGTAAGTLCLLWACTERRPDTAMRTPAVLGQGLWPSSRSQGILVPLGPGRWP